MPAPGRGAKLKLQIDKALKSEDTFERGCALIAGALLTVADALKPVPPKLFREEEDRPRPPAPRRSPWTRGTPPSPPPPDLPHPTYNGDDDIPF